MCETYITGFFWTFLHSILIHDMCILYFTYIVCFRLFQIAIYISTPCTLRFKPFLLTLDMKVNRMNTILQPPPHLWPFSRIENSLVSTAHPLLFTTLRYYQYMNTIYSLSSFQNYSIIILQCVFNWFSKCILAQTLTCRFHLTRRMARIQALNKMITLFDFKHNKPLILTIVFQVSLASILRWVYIDWLSINVDE